MENPNAEKRGIDADSVLDGDPDGQTVKGIINALWDDENWSLSTVALAAFKAGKADQTLRDHFAAQALVGLLSGQWRDGGYYNLSEVPEEAFRVADAMVAARTGK